MEKLLCGIAIISSVFIAGSALAMEIIPVPDAPTDVSQCKQSGWISYDDMFKNQGDCVSFVVTDGRNQADGN